MKTLSEKLSYNFKDEALALTAMTHSSYANEHHIESNERLEFLGDSVLGMVTAEYLYGRFPDLPEGKMTKLRSELVCEGGLYAVADELSFGENLRLGKGEESTGGRTRHSILADCVEATIAAMYLDGGIEPAKNFIYKYILSRTDEVISHKSTDAKTALQEKIQAKRGRTLSYNLVEESGPDHNKEFTFEALLNGERIGLGKGKTKKEAEQAAAADALRGLN